MAITPLQAGRYKLEEEPNKNSQLNLWLRWDDYGELYIGPLLWAKIELLN